MNESPLSQNEITGAVMVKLGYTENENILISTDAKGHDGETIKGFISTETDDSYINDKNNNSNSPARSLNIHKQIK